MDNATRWNSVYRMLTRALNVRERLTKFVREHKPQNTTGGEPQSERYRPQNERLTAKDWTFLERLHSALEAFYAATMVTQGHEPWLSDWFTTLHWLLNEVYAWKVDALEEQGDEHLAACLGASWNKIEKYYKLVDNAHVYYAAILLNPTLKTAKLREMWSSEETAPWVSQVEEYVKAIWRTQYKPIYQPSTICRRLYDEDSAFSRLSSAKRLRLDASSEPVDALDAYLSIDPVPFNKDDTSNSFDVIGWWQQRQHTYPGLAQMAFDVFGVPLMSDNNERSFSSGRDMITYRRTRLINDIIEACQCLRSWLLPSNGRPEELFDDEDTIIIDMGHSSNTSSDNSQFTDTLPN